jgi:hypothetical protein
MTAAKRLSPEQIVANLREAESLQGQGATIPQVCKKLDCAEQTFGALAAVAAASTPDTAAIGKEADAQAPPTTAPTGRSTALLTPLQGPPPFSGATSLKSGMRAGTRRAQTRRAGPVRPSTGRHRNPYTVGKSDTGQY